MKKGDIIVIGAIVVAFILSLVLLFSFSTQGDRVIIKQNNEVIYNKSIDVNNMVNTGTNTVVIEDGVVYVENATCKNRVCVNTGKISKKGESIVCLPNRMIVEIK